jgi:hypothetical protein
MKFFLLDYSYCPVDLILVPGPWSLEIENYLSIVGLVEKIPSLTQEGTSSLESRGISILI